MKTEKIEIKEKSKKLQAIWTVALEQGEAEIGDEAARILQEEIDWEIMSDIMKSMGWAHVSVPWNKTTDSQAHEIKEWLKENVTGHYKGRGSTWLFERKEDATLFALRWS